MSSSNEAEQLDLTKEEAGAPEPDGLPLPFETRTVAHRQESARWWIAGALLAPLGFIVVAAFLSLWFNLATGEELRDVLTLIFAPVVGLVGAVVGFYFGERSATRR